MDDFSQRILLNYCNKQNPSKTISEFSSNLTQKLLLEAETVWVMIQALVAEELLNHPKVELWGLNNVKDWQLLNNNQKMNEILELWNEKGATKEARNFIDLHPQAEKIESGWLYDIKDVSTPYNNKIDDHYKDVKKSKVFNDVKNLFLSYFESRNDQVQQ